MLIRHGLFLASDKEMMCIISGFNLFKDIAVNKLEDVLFEGARAMIYTNDMKHVHPFVKSLLNANFIGDIKVEYTDKNLKEDFIVPIINELFAVNNIIMQKWNSLHTPKGYLTVNVHDYYKTDIYTTQNTSFKFYPYKSYDIRGNKLFRYTLPKDEALAY